MSRLIDVEALAEMLREFAAERDWEQFHTPKNLAMALGGEAGELLAELQWLTPEESVSLSDEHYQRVADEIADVVIYAVRLCDVMGIDLDEAVKTKMEANANRYTVENSRGSSEKR